MAPKLDEILDKDGETLPANFEGVGVHFGDKNQLKVDTPESLRHNNEVHFEP